MRLQNSWLTGHWQRLKTKAEQDEIPVVHQSIYQLSINPGDRETEKPSMDYRPTQI